MPAHRKDNYLHFEETSLTNVVNFTNTYNTTLRLLYGHVVYTSSATGGSRWIGFSVTTDAGNLVNDIHAGDKIGSGVIRHFNFMYGVNREVAFIDDEIQVPIPTESMILPNWVISIHDEDAIDVNDTMQVDLVFEFK